MTDQERKDFDNASGDERPQEQVDITGLMAEAIPDWQERAKALCHPEMFSVVIAPTRALQDHLSPVELRRLREKLALVTRFTQYMSAGMLKGTIKYPKELNEVSLDQWMAHLIGEGADQANYSILLFNSFQANKE